MGDASFGASLRYHGVSYNIFFMYLGLESKVKL